jgi:glycosyltransferase involved in cell wall biosynthesis
MSAQTMPSATTNPSSPLIVFDTHPIQYRSPVFRAIHQRFEPFKVWFFNESFDGNKWWFHEVGKIPAQDWSLPLKEGFPNQVMNTARLGFRKTWHELRRILRAEKPRAIAIYGYYLPEHWMIRRLTAEMNIPLIFIGETFSQGTSLPRRLIKKPFQRYFFRGVTQFIAIGTKTRLHYRTFGIDPSRIVSAKYCTDVSFFGLADGEARKVRNAWRKSLGIDPEAFVILFVGRLFERKRPTDMLRIHQLLGHLPHLSTVMVGNGPLEESLRQESERIPNLLMLGFKNQPEIRDCYHGADVLVVPSEFETWGLVVNEAFAAGTPAVVTHTCGAAGDLVIPGETGYVYEMGNVEQAAKFIQLLAESRSLCAELSRRAKSRVTQDYSVDQFAQAFLEALGKASS